MAGYCDILGKGIIYLGTILARENKLFYVLTRLSKNVIIVTGNKGDNMKNLLIIIFCLWLVGCKEQTQEQKEEINAIKSEYAINCIDVGNLYRCENQEVVCYSDYGVESLSLQCKFK